MATFAIDADALAAGRERAARRASSGEGADLFEKLRVREPLDDEAIGALFLAEDVATEELLDLARGLRAPDAPRIETFSPLYISNECDGECAMCGMSRFNRDLQRATADEATVREQIDILHRRGLRGVAILTGEYRRGARRRSMLARAASATRYAIERGFTHVLINVGSIEVDEFPLLLAGVPRAGDGISTPRVTMCTFQESYDPSVYRSFMGTTPENPRSDYERRLGNFDRAADAGMRSANPGILLGLNRDLVFELLAVLAHVRHLLARRMVVYVSLPRLRKASGVMHRAGVSDDALTRLVSVLSAAVPEAKVVISTREAPEIQRRLLPVMSVLTPGSPGVAPYTEADAAFDVEASQFEVADHRPIEVILGECLAAGARIDGYEPAGAARAVSTP